MPTAANGRAVTREDRTRLPFTANNETGGLRRTSSSGQIAPSATPASPHRRLHRPRPALLRAALGTRPVERAMPMATAPSAARYARLQGDPHRGADRRHPRLRHQARQRCEKAQQEGRRQAVGITLQTNMRLRPKASTSASPRRKRVPQTRVPGEGRDPAFARSANRDLQRISGRPHMQSERKAKSSRAVSIACAKNCQDGRTANMKLHASRSFPRLRRPNIRPHDTRTNRIIRTGNPAALYRWIDAVLMLFAELVSYAVSTLQMVLVRRTRECHTTSVRPKTCPSDERPSSGSRSGRINRPLHRKRASARVPRAGGNPRLRTPCGHANLGQRASPLSAHPDERRDPGERRTLFRACSFKPSQACKPFPDPGGSSWSRSKDARMSGLCCAKSA